MGLDEIPIDFGHNLVHDWGALAGQRLEAKALLPSQLGVGRQG